MHHPRLCGPKIRRHRIAQTVQISQLALIREALCLVGGAIGKGVLLSVKPVIERFVGPFEIKGQRDGLTDTDVFEHLAAKVEDNPRHRGRITIAQLFAHHVTTGQCREIIAGRPLLGLRFSPERHVPRLERLKGCGGVGEIFQADPVEIITPLADRQIRAPIVGVTLIDDAAVWHDLTDHIRPRPR